MSIPTVFAIVVIQSALSVAANETPPVLPAPAMSGFVINGVVASSHPVWSTDGRLVVFVKALETGQTDHELRALDITTGIERILGRVPYLEPGTEKRRDPNAFPQPQAATAGANIVWLGSGPSGLWSWRPFDGRLTQLHTTPPADRRIRPFCCRLVVPNGPDSRIAIVDDNQAAVLESDGITVQWLQLANPKGHNSNAVTWWNNHLLDLGHDGSSRLLWPTPPTVTAPTFSADKGPGRYCWLLATWDAVRGERLTAEIPGGTQPRLALQAGSSVLTILDNQGEVRATRTLADGVIRERLRTASAAERSEPLKNRRTADPDVYEAAEVLAYHYPHAVLRYSLHIRYGFGGTVVGAFARYNVDSGQMEPFGNDIYHWIDSGVPAINSDASRAKPSPDARAVAFCDNDRLVVLR
ncbi:MAG: hypothetical protein AAB263_16245 [Planctomycetota bacterium]